MLTVIGISPGQVCLWSVLNNTMWSVFFQGSISKSLGREYTIAIKSTVGIGIRHILYWTMPLSIPALVWFPPTLTLGLAIWLILANETLESILQDKAFSVGFVPWNGLLRTKLHAMGKSKVFYYRKILCGESLEDNSLCRKKGHMQIWDLQSGS